VIIWWILVRRRVVAKARVIAPHSEVELGALLQPLEPFLGYFDFLSSVFIFTGLVGTIVGFIHGLPKLQESTWNFEDLIQALSTSAAGIVFSVLLSLIVLVLEGWLIHPLVADLRTATLADPFGQYIRQLLEQHTSMFTSAVSTFTTAAGDLSGRIGTWTLEAIEWKTAFTQAAEKSLVTAASIQDSLEQIRKLPPDIATSIAQTVETHAAAFSASLKNVRKAADSLEDVPRQLEKKIQPIYAALFERLEKHFQKIHAQTVERAQVIEALMGRVEGVPSSLAEVLEAAKDRIEKTLLGQQQTFVAELKREHDAVLPELRRVGTETVANQIITLDQHAQKMQDRATQMKEVFDLALSREREMLRDGILSTMTEVARIIDEYRQKLRDVELVLPQELTNAYRNTATGVRDAAGAATIAADRIERAVIALGTAAVQVQELSRAIEQLVKLSSRPEEPRAPSQQAPVSTPGNTSSAPPGYEPHSTKVTENGSGSATAFASDPVRVPTSAESVGSKPEPLRRRSFVSYLRSWLR
jgi:ABC-type transporter Mla subunit MlaD